MSNCWSRSKIGTNRVYWFAARGHTWESDFLVLGEGVVTTVEEAEESAKRLAGHDAGQTRAYVAAWRYRAQVKERKSSRRARRQEVHVREYLYSFGWSDWDGSRYTLAHLILKRTRRRVYVTKRSHSVEVLGTEDEVWDHPYDDPDIVLDRVALERDGEVWSGAHRQRFYERPDALDMVTGGRLFPALGLTTPFTQEEVKMAYRRRVKEAHPDLGGDPATFMSLEQQYREAWTWAQPR